jgi:predicted DNA-binding transcriptional regulator YafY
LRTGTVLNNGDTQDVIDTSARLLRLLSLLQTRPEWPGSELARRLGVTSRTLRRDVQRLRDLDYPVHSVPGVAGGYRLGAGAAMPPLQLDDDEAIAVVVSLRSATSQSLTGLAEASVSALAKLDQVMPPRLQRRTSALQHATVALTGPVAVIDPAMLTTIAGACRGHERLTLRYRDHHGTASERTVEPYRLVSASYRWYLMAYDIGRHDWRTLRVDRISDLATAGRFAAREAPEPVSFVSTAITTAPYRYQAKVVLHGSAAEFAARITPSAGMLSAMGEDRCLLTTGSDSVDALLYHLLVLDAEFTVLEPPELIERMHWIAGRLTRATVAHS